MITFYVALLALHLIGIRGDCDYSKIIPGFEDVKFASIPNDGYVISKKQFLKIISNGGKVHVYCDAGFTWLQNRDYYRKERNEEIGKSMTIFCNDDYMQFHLQNNVLNEEDFYPHSSIFCAPSYLNLYSAKLDHCGFDGLRLGMNIENVPIVSLELCHDFGNSEPIFSHYIAAQRSNVLAKQIQYNPSNITRADLSHGALVTVEDEIPPIIKLGNEFNLFIPSLKHLLSEINYEYNELTPRTVHSAINIDAYSRYKFNTLNSVPWWTPLRVGNWEAFQKILSRQVEEGSYRIYAGKSHKASFPKEFVCNSETDMTYDFDGQRKYIPLYIWQYIIPQNPHNEEFVLIGVNSPFVKAIDNSSLIFCQDMCDQIPWLKPLEATRKIASFGYMFCCKPIDVHNILDGFPLREYWLYNLLNGNFNYNTEEVGNYSNDWEYD